MATMTTAWDCPFCSRTALHPPSYWQSFFFLIFQSGKNFVMYAWNLLLWLGSIKSVSYTHLVEKIPAFFFFFLPL